MIETLKPATTRTASRALHRRGGEVHPRTSRTGRSSSIWRTRRSTCRCIPARSSRANRPTAPMATGWRRSTPALGRVLDTLRELKLDENTLVIFTSDNGPWLMQGKNGGIAGPLARRQGRHLRRRHARADHRLVAGPHRRRKHLRRGRRRNRSAADVREARRRHACPTTARSTARTFRLCCFGKSKESPREAPFLFRRQPAPGRPLRPVEAGDRPAEASKPASRSRRQTGAVHAEALQPRRRHRRDDRRGRQASRRCETTARIRSEDGRRPGGDEKGPGVRPPGRVEMPRPLLLK